MKKIGIITLNGYFNYGNRLQNYALSYVLKEKGFNVYTIWNKGLKFKIKSIIKVNLPIKSSFKRFKKFYLFSKKNIQEINLKKLEKNPFEYIVIGSDQVWNCMEVKNNKTLLGRNVNGIKKISYAASFGVSEIPNQMYRLYKECLNDLSDISVREDVGIELIKKITSRNDAIILIDPTMLLTDEEWDRMAKCPKQYKGEKYILNYFLGNLSNERKQEIENMAKENNCKIFNILDKNDPYYISDPSEFLWLEKNAFLICTDSFHSSVFAILYNRPFVVFDREEVGMNNMGSRVDTLLSKFKLKNRRYNGKNITKENLEHDYTEAYKILEEERKKSNNFLEKALDMKEDYDG